MAGVGQRSEQQVKGKLDEFAKQWPTWSWLRVKLQEAGLEPTAARAAPSRELRCSWALFVSPSAALAYQFDLAPEILVLCSPWEVMQANDIRWTEGMFNEEIRLDPGFVLVITADNTAEERLKAAIPEHRCYIFVSAEAFEEELDPQAMLRRTLRDALGRRRLFDERFPAEGRQFFGRKKELETLERDVLTSNCVGVFGLRKVGKTSLLRRLAEKFRSASPTKRVVPVEVDMQELGFSKRNLEGLGGLVRRKLEAELHREAIQIPQNSPDPFERVVQVIETVEREQGARILLIIDEYEVLLDGRRIPKSDGVDFLTWLRGIAQGHSNGFGFILAGRNAKFLMPARIDGVDNPMYRFLKSFPLTGLTPEDCRTMVRQIGRRMALDFQSDALDMIVEETGGHPALARTLGNLVDDAIALTKRNPAIVTATVLMKQIMPRFSRDAAVSDDMAELVNASLDSDERAEDYLVHLAHGVPWLGGPVEHRIHEALANYGILHQDGNDFRIGHLAVWLRENYRKPAEVAHG